MSQQINLFNPVFLQQKKLFAAHTMAQSLGLLALGALLMTGAAWYSVGQLRQEARAVDQQAASTQARLAAATAEFVPRKSDPALIAEALDAEARLTALRRVAHTVQSGELGNTHGYAEHFRALGRQHQDGLWLTAVGIGLGSDMSLQGRALDATLVPGYIARLTQEPVLRGKAFANLKISQPAVAPVVATTAAPAPAPASAPETVAGAGTPAAPVAPVAPAAPARAPFIEFSLQASPAEVAP